MKAVRASVEEIELNLWRASLTGFRRGLHGGSMLRQVSEAWSRYAIGSRSVASPMF